MVPEEGELLDVVAPPDPDPCPTVTLPPQAGTRRRAAKKIAVRIPVGVTRIASRVEPAGTARGGAEDAWSSGPSCPWLAGRAVHDLLRHATTGHGPTHAAFAGTANIEEGIRSSIIDRLKIP